MATNGQSQSDDAFDDGSAGPELTVGPTEVNAENGQQPTNGHSRGNASVGDLMIRPGQPAGNPSFVRDMLTGSVFETEYLPRTMFYSEGDLSLYLNEMMQLDVAEYGVVDHRKMNWIRLHGRIAVGREGRREAERMMRAERDHMKEMARNPAFLQRMLPDNSNGTSSGEKVAGANG